MSEETSDNSFVAQSLKLLPLDFVGSSKDQLNDWGRYFENMVADVADRVSVATSHRQKMPEGVAEISIESKF